MHRAPGEGFYQGNFTKCPSCFPSLWILSSPLRKTWHRLLIGFTAAHTLAAPGCPEEEWMSARWVEIGTWPDYVIYCLFWIYNVMIWVVKLFQGPDPIHPTP